MNKDELFRLTLRQLRQQASKLSVPLYSRKTKAVLIDLIISYQDQKLNDNEVLVQENPPTLDYQTQDKPAEKSTDVRTNLVFLPRDPEWAYVFWQISDSDREKAQSLGASKLCLRLFDVTGLDNNDFNQSTMREIAVDSYSTEWYLPIPVADRDYKVELGYRYGFNWMSLAFSSSSHVPSSHPSEQILDKFVPFNLDSPSETNNTILHTEERVENGLHERLYHAATSYPKSRRVGSEEFMEKLSTSNDNLNDSGSGLWSSGINDSGSGLLSKSFWLVADAELIVYGATDPSATLTIGGEKVPLASDGTFRLQVPFRDGSQQYEIKAVDSDGVQERNITMNFDRNTPIDNTNNKDTNEPEWFE